MKLFEIYHRWKHKGGFIPELQDIRDYVLGWDWGAKPYTPKKIRTDNPTVDIKDQNGINICVTASGTTGKEPDEEMLLDYQWLSAYLRSKGQMGDKGTSLSLFQKALLDVGIPQKKKEINNKQSWLQFSNPSQLTQDSFNDAKIHKIKSFFATHDINKVLEELDNGKLGASGTMWYSGYNKSQLNSYAIIELLKGTQAGGHAILITGYDQDYHGFKVLKCANSYGKNYGKEGFFYVKWEDFSKFFQFGVYFNSDLPKDALSWLSLNQGKLVKDFDSPDIYLIQSDYKRYIPDEAILLMLLITANQPKFIEDKDKMLPLVKKGEIIKFDEIPAWAKETAEQMARWSQYPEWTKKTFQKYFPNL